MGVEVAVVNLVYDCTILEEKDTEIKERIDKMKGIHSRLNT
jgi:hypothetical protein